MGNIELEQCARLTLERVQKLVTLFLINRRIVAVDLAEHVEKQSTLSAAAASFLQVVGLRPDYVRPYVRLGRIAEKRAQLPEALSLFQHAVDGITAGDRATPASIYPSIYSSLGYVLHQLNRTDEAAGVFQAGLDHRIWHTAWQYPHSFTPSLTAEPLHALPHPARRRLPLPLLVRDGRDLAAGEASRDALGVVGVVRVVHVVGDPVGAEVGTEVLEQLLQSA